MERYHGFFTHVGETSRWQVRQFNMGKRKSLTLKNGVTFSRLRNGHTVVCNDHRKMQTREFVFVDGKFRSVTPHPTYVGIDMGKD